MSKKVYARKNQCPVCGKAIVYARVVKENGRTTHRAYHEDSIPAAANVQVVDYKEVNHTYRKQLRDAIDHTIKMGKPVFDGRGIKNRIIFVTEVLNTLKDGGMSDDTARKLRSEMMAKGKGFKEDVEIVRPYIDIIMD